MAAAAGGAGNPEFDVTIAIGQPTVAAAREAATAGEHARRRLQQAGELPTMTLADMADAALEGTYDHTRTMHIVFHGDTRTHEVRGSHGREASAAAALAAVLRHARQLSHLRIDGFSAYYDSLAYRRSQPVDELFSELGVPGCDEAEAVVSPTITRLTLHWCCLNDADIKRIGPSFPHVRTVRLVCCAGHSTAAMEGYLVPYVFVDHENDDSWHVSQGGGTTSKNQFIHVGPPDRMLDACDDEAEVLVDG